MIIYMATNRINGKEYIGQTVLIGGIKYHTKKQAAEKTGISLYLINKLINKGEVVLL